VALWGNHQDNEASNQQMDARFMQAIDALYVAKVTPYLTRCQVPRIATVIAPNLVPLPNLRPSHGKGEHDRAEKQKIDRCYATKIAISSG